MKNLLIIMVGLKQTLDTRDVPIEDIQHLLKEKESETLYHH